ncbi:MAG: restriction endonuclease, partial [Nitrospira sp.]|nr:restriction endonuclease [Nitrospira sp.]
LINRLEGPSELLVLPNENISFILGEQHVVAISNVGGISAFLDEKEKIKARNAQENIILFADKRMKWTIKTKSDSSLFEDLVLELLVREPYIHSAKKVAPTNQGDNGRDIICEYNTAYNNLRVGKQQSSLEIGQLIVQCKTNIEGSKKKSIGKSDVDVADTIYDYKPDAYLLVVNSQVTRDLTEYFEKIRNRDDLHWIDWW